MSLVPAVLANEQVIEERASARDSFVEAKKLTQWFFRITDYAERLLQDFDKLESWPERVITMQRNWIGKSQGANVVFTIASAGRLGRAPPGGGGRGGAARPQAHDLAASEAGGAAPRSQSSLRGRTPCSERLLHPGPRASTGRRTGLAACPKRRRSGVTWQKPWRLPPSRGPASRRRRPACSPAATRSTR